MGGFLWLYCRFLIQMFLKRVGFPWSCSEIGSFCSWGEYAADFLCAVAPRNSTLSCTVIPLCSTVIRAGFKRRPSLLKMGILKMTSYDCHLPGFRHAFTRGGYWPYSDAAWPSGYVLFRYESRICSSYRPMKNTPLLPRSCPLPTTFSGVAHSMCNWQSPNPSFV